MFADHLASRRSDQVLEPDPHLGEDGSPLAKAKTANEAEELRLKGASWTVPAQSSSGKNMGEDGSSLTKKKTANELGELHIEGSSWTVPAQSSSGKKMGESKTGTTSYTERKILLSLILYGFKGFTLPHDVVPCPLSKEHVRMYVSFIYGACFIHLSCCLLYWSEFCT